MVIITPDEYIRQKPISDISVLLTDVRNREGINDVTHLAKHVVNIPPRYKEQLDFIDSLSGIFLVTARTNQF